MKNLQTGNIGGDGAEFKELGNMMQNILGGLADNPDGKGGDPNMENLFKNLP